MPMTCIEPYRPPRPDLRELLEGRPAGEGYLGRPPKWPTRRRTGRRP